MPGCAAIGCNNRSEKGYTMKCFPRDPFLRKIWKQKVGRADWEPSNNSFLCHEHFDSSQRIVLANGKIKLKKGALPSIFTITSTRKSQKKKFKPFIQLEEISDNEVELIENDDSIIYNLVNEKVMTMQPQESTSISQILQNVKIISGDTLKDVQNENIIIVAAENNKEIGKIVNNTGFFMLKNEIGKENVRILPKLDKSNSTEVKLEIKEETAENNLNSTDYDEIEKKLKEICQGNETELSSNNTNLNENKSQSIESIFSLVELENGSNDPKENSNQGTEINNSVSQAGIKRKPEDSESSNSDCIEISHSSNKLNTSLSTEGLKNIIYDLEDENLVEQTKKPKLISMVTSQSNGTGKPIIKNDIQFKLKNNIIKGTVPRKKNELFNSNKIKSSGQTVEEKLSNKLSVQSEVIEKLTNQLIIYKDVERKMNNLSQELNNKNIKLNMLTQKLTEKKSLPEMKILKNECFDLTDQSKSELIKNKFKILEENNRKLMKALAAETEKRKKLEFQLKSKDNQIKYMNWKLQKASKFFDRAEKNANNYKKKMLATQAFIKRKNLNNEKITSTFDEFLVGQLDKKFSDSTMKKALTIEQACGIDGYKKLLSYEFPMPSLKELSKKYPTEIDYYEPDEEAEEVMILETEKSKVPVSASSIKMENVEFLDADFLNKSDETVSKTVEDIFNESDDDDEILDLDELRKHISFDLLNQNEVQILERID